jgi:hypothetical protein
MPVQERQGGFNTLIVDRAKEAINRLDIGSFIEEHRAKILRSLEQKILCNRGEDQAALLFIADGLPLASGVIQIGSSVAHFREAQDWVKETLPDADTGSFLSVLTLLYMVHRGCEVALQSGNPSSQELWNEMSQRVQAELDAA